MKKLRESYRPERHYMRGPGPKWQAKHSNPLAAQTKPKHGVPYSLWVVVPMASAALLGAFAVIALA